MDSVKLKPIPTLKMESKTYRLTKGPLDIQVNLDLKASQKLA
jgi:hypothetical protein